MSLVPNSFNEPSDEDLDLEEVARQVDGLARPLFVTAMIWLTRRALRHDQDEAQ